VIYANKDCRQTSPCIPGKYIMRQHGLDVEQRMAKKV